MDGDSQLDFLDDSNGTTFTLPAKFRINELVSVNGSYPDEDAEYPSWVELYNGENYPVNLNGWTCWATGASWTFPDTTIQPDGYLVVFTSGKNRTEPKGNLHTNFQLNPAGGAISLTSAHVAFPGGGRKSVTYPKSRGSDSSYSFFDQMASGSAGFGQTGATGGAQNKGMCGIAAVIRGNSDLPWTPACEGLEHLCSMNPPKGYAVDDIDVPLYTWYLTDQLDKYQIVVINVHGWLTDYPRHGYFWVPSGYINPPFTETNLWDSTVKEFYADKGKAFLYVHLNSCRSGEVGDLWQSAWNARALFGWINKPVWYHIDRFEEAYWCNASVMPLGMALENADLETLDAFFADIVASYIEFDFSNYATPIIHGDLSLNLVDP